MSDTQASELCRLTIYGPTRTTEVAVPSHLPLVDLQPELLRLAGPGVAQQGITSNGWVLQRLGEAPLDDLLSPAELNLRDGGALYLRPRDAQLPLADFDDVVDGVATAVRQRPDRWRPALTRTVLLGVLGVVLAGGLAMLALAGPALPRAVTAWLLALGLWGASAAAVRILRDEPVGVLFALAAVCYSGYGGAVLPTGSGGPGPVLLSAMAPLSGMALLLLLTVPVAREALVAILLGSLLGTTLGVMQTVFHLTAVHGAALGLVLAIGLGAMVPLRAVRLAGIRIRPLPHSADALQEDVEPEPGRELMVRAAQADRYATALYAALCTVSGLCLVLLSTGSGWTATALCLTGAVLVLLYARGLENIWQRLSMVGAGVAGLAGAGWHAATRWPVEGRLAAAVGLVVLAGVLAGAARSLPGHRLMPIWGRLGDLTQGAAALALVPLCAAVLEVYQWVRSAIG
ncbi:type VII secretion integral membrane protein EccD [Actinoplanes sp. NPDC051859]|uniref:type VII secretion integral membrane protein EccD n=1 Tax=Actinoplanes sp. NPDC051859 TaxID=3363909 RepID=UPI00379C8700